MANETSGYETLPKSEFDKLARQKELWEVQPMVERPDSTVPYSPGLEVLGILKSGRKLRTVIG